MGERVLVLIRIIAAVFDSAHAVGDSDRDREVGRRRGVLVAAARVPQIPGINTELTTIRLTFHELELEAHGVALPKDRVSVIRAGFAVQAFVLGRG